MTGFVTVLVSVGSREEAARIGRTLVERRLAACIQILPIDSIYRWEEAIEEAQEFLLLAKASASDFTMIEEAIRSQHAYEVPEIVAVPILAGSAPYLSWLGSSTDRSSIAT